MPPTEPKLLETYISSLRRQNINEDTIALLSAVAEQWIKTLRGNPRRLSGDEV